MRDRRATVPYEQKPFDFRRRFVEVRLSSAAINAYTRVWSWTKHEQVKKTGLYKVTMSNTQINIIFVLAIAGHVHLLQDKTLDTNRRLTDFAWKRVGKVCASLSFLAIFDSWWPGFQLLGIFWFAMKFYRFNFRACNFVFLSKQLTKSFYSFFPPNIHPMFPSN